MGVLSGIHLVSIVGPQGTGKSTTGELLAQRWHIPHLEASSVVRKVCGDLPRADMPKTNERTKTDPTWLGTAIAHEILENTDSSTIIVSGVRETEVHQTFRELGCGSLTVILVLSDTRTRYHRQLEANKCSSYEEFTKHDENEVSIGLLNVIENVDFTVGTQKSTADEVVDRIVMYLESLKGAE